MALLAWLWLLRYSDSVPFAFAVSYLPTLLAFAPFPPLAIACFVRRDIGSALVVLGGFALCIVLTGFRFATPTANSPSSPSKVRVFTLNSWGLDPRGVVDEFARERPDLVLFQATHHPMYETLASPPLSGFLRQRLGQFAIASRWPIVSWEEAPDFHTEGGAPWARWTLQTPEGPIDVINIHPLSVHEAGRDLLRRRMFDSERIEAALDLLTLQFRSISDAVARSEHPLIVAGDTNLPQQSPIVPQHLNNLRDAFEQSGAGFGYTYPCFVPKVPAFLRLDRVETGPGFRAVAARVGARGVSSHCALVVDLVRVHGETRP